MNRFVLTIGLLFGCHALVSAQSSLRDSSANGLLIGFSYGYQLSFADLSERFGNNGLVGGELSYKLKSNWTFGAEGGYMFGRKVKETGFLDSLDDGNGYFVGYTGIYSGVALYERGYSIGATVGKILPAFGSNPNSGFYARVGAGFMQHKIKIEDTDGNLYYFSKDYLKGYDRLSNGLMLSQYIGYLNVDPRNLLNFHVGVYAQQGITQNRRDWNFDERRKDNETRLDVLVGLRATWMLTFFGRSEERAYTH